VNYHQLLVSHTMKTKNKTELLPGLTTKVLRMSLSSMKEMCLYVEQARKQRAAEHRRKHQHDGLCSGLTDKEYKQVVHKQKSSFSKARKFTHSGMWRETHKKFDTKQLNIIKKCI
jgi:hypothetical protein